MVDNKEKAEKKGERVAKVIANSGYCSRREAERLIAGGFVQINGVPIDTPAIMIIDQTIKIKNKLLPRNEKIKMWIFYKPKGFMVTNRDPHGRKTIYDILPTGLPRVIAVGRLDMDTEGLLLLTNNGSVARYIEHPANGWTRQYRIKVHGSLDKLRANLDSLAKSGIVVDGIKYRPLKISIEKESETTNTWLLISLREGKNREVRNIMEHFGLRVTRLIRTSFGPFHIGAMSSGDLKSVARKAMEGALGGRVSLS
ncbi:MAG: rRNA pseudouridine synthase [Rickettsiales bacterium]|jgi:23S rRNA pseudouridine2605 synthase|nr:rRNA pseudouridine synthase [Rickettsiales bacterium]